MFEKVEVFEIIQIRFKSNLGFPHICKNEANAYFTDF